MTPNDLANPWWPRVIIDDPRVTLCDHRLTPRWPPDDPWMTPRWHLGDPREPKGDNRWSPTDPWVTPKWARGDPQIKPGWTQVTMGDSLWSWGDLGWPQNDPRWPWHHPRSQQVTFVHMRLPSGYLGVTRRHQRSPLVPWGQPWSTRCIYEQCISK